VDQEKIDSLDPAVRRRMISNATRVRASFDTVLFLIEHDEPVEQMDRHEMIEAYRRKGGRRMPPPRSQQVTRVGGEY